MDIRVESPFPFEALPRVWAWISRFREKVSDDFSPQTLTDFVSHMAAKWDRQRTWAIYAEGELGGLISFERLSPWLGTAHILLKPDFQGRGIAVKACRSAVAAMFAEGIGKLGFYPLAGNLAIGSLLINLGADREGKLKAHTLCGGKPTDIWVYGLTKESFEEKQHASSNYSVHPGDHRGGGVDRGSCAGRQAEDHHRERPAAADHGIDGHEFVHQ